MPGAGGCHRGVQPMGHQSGAACTTARAQRHSRRARCDGGRGGSPSQPFVTSDAWHTVAASTSPIAVATSRPSQAATRCASTSRGGTCCRVGDEGARSGLIRCSTPTSSNRYPARVPRRHRHRGGSAPMAEQLVNKRTVNRPIEEAWPVICDVERIAPACQVHSSKRSRATSTTALMKIKLGISTIEGAGPVRRTGRRDPPGEVEAGRDTGGRGNAAADITANSCRRRAPSAR